VIAGVLACNRGQEAGAGDSGAPSVVVAPAPAPSKPTEPRGGESIAFADRTSLAYVLLVPGTAKAPTRDELVALVDRELGSRTDEPEVDVLRQFVKMEPADAIGQVPPGDDRPHDLIGVHIEALDAQGTKAAVAEAALADPVLTRELSPGERDSLPSRTTAILLRGDYRNERAIRGLRLLQTLVRLVATDRGALIHDPDTGETLGVDAFVRRRLQAGLGNVADQIAVVPFPDRVHGEPWIRLTTRGMRRFGSPDLELDGLPRDEQALQRATFLLHGLAFQMARLAELDPSGYPIEFDDDLEVSRGDITKAYARLQGAVPTCSDCVGAVSVALRKRPGEPHDPQGHLVVRLVPPADDPAAGDHAAWVITALTKLFGE
jgi:hypothetical protein